MPVAVLNPNERYAFVGKTRSGKTALAMVLAGTYARALDPPWEVWWIDTKNDPKDLAALRRWGFRNAMSLEDRETSAVPNAVYFRVPSKDEEGYDISTVMQVQYILSMAYERGHIIVVIDEYVQAVPSKRSAGSALLDVFQRGGGKNVGIIGLTQEPVDVPRQLLSQATHLVLFTLTYEYDKQYITKMVKEYEPPIKMGEPHGFWWKWVDGDGEVTFFPNQKQWYDTVSIALPRSRLDAQQVVAQQA